MGEHAATAVCVPEASLTVGGARTADLAPQTSFSRSQLEHDEQFVSVACLRSIRFRHSPRAYRGRSVFKMEKLKETLRERPRGTCEELETDRAARPQQQE